MLSLNSWHLDNNQVDDIETSKNPDTAAQQDSSTEQILQHFNTQKE
jgi:hypothetical protein